MAFTVWSGWSYARHSSRGGSLCPGTAPLFSLPLTDTSTSPTPLLRTPASTSALPPVPWAMLAERSSSVSTVRQHPNIVFDVMLSRLILQMGFRESDSFQFLDTVHMVFLQLLFFLTSHAKDNGCEWPWQHSKDGCRGGDGGRSTMWGPGKSFSTSHMEKKRTSHPSCHSWVRQSHISPWHSGSKMKHKVTQDKSSSHTLLLSWLVSDSSFTAFTRDWPGCNSKLL